MVETNEPAITEVKLDTYNTGTVIEIYAKFESAIKEGMSEAEKDLERQKFIFWYLNHEKGFIENMYIINSNDETFFNSNSNFDDSEHKYLYDGTFYYKNTIDMTQYNMTKTLTLYLTIHTIDEDKNVIMKFEETHLK